MTKGRTQNSPRGQQLSPQARGARTRKANQAARTAHGNKATGKSTGAEKATTAKSTTGTRTTTTKKTGAKSPKRKQSRTAAGREAGERLRPIARSQTLTETVANIGIRAGQPMETVKRVLQATQRVAEAHLRRGGSGKIALPYLGVQIYRAQQRARPARDMELFKTGRIIHLGRTPARSIARARVLTAMKNAPLR